MRGWLLDVYPTGEDEMVLCMKGEDGETRLFRDEYTPEFYVHGSLEKLEELEDELGESEAVGKWSYDEKKVRLRDLNPSRVIRVECSSMEKLGSFAKRVARLGNYRDYELYNVDVPYAQDYLHEKNLFPLANVELENVSELDFHLLDSVTDTEPELPPLKKAGLNVEPDSAGPARGFDDPLGKITVSLKETEAEIEGFDEREEILKLVNLVKDQDPDIILTKGGDSWDLPYLAHRAKVNDISDRIILGRKPEAIKEKDRDGTSFFSYGQVYYKPPPHYLKGRIHVNTENSFIHGECGLQGLIELARITRTPLQKTARSSIGFAMTNLQLYWARENEVLIPWRKSEPEDFKTGLKLLKADRGGFIHSPEIGLHENVAEIDFSSFYPKMMEKYNISPETVLCECCPDSEERVPELDYNICEERKGLIPQVLKPVLEKRDMYKELISKGSDPASQENYDQRQEALKWILVTCFGYLGYRNARFGRIEAHEAVTAFARKKLKKASRTAEEEGFQVVHGIVDSLWVKGTDPSKSELKALCDRIRTKTGLPIDLEGRYRWLVLPAGRGESRTPVPNRYYGVFENGELKARGIAARRRNTPEIISTAQGEMLEKLATAKDRNGFMEKTEESLEALKRYITRVKKGVVNPEHLAVTTKLSREPGSYKANARSAIAAKQLQRTGVDLHPGQQVKYVVTDAGADNPELRVKPLQLVNKGNYDPKWYTERLIASAEEILNPFGYTEKKIGSSLQDNGQQKKLAGGKTHHLS
ncbi:hypothetical protein AKJ62_00795 [candidate division MSBL1 archaeon SCGC-AAA259D14]|uniref:DNA-directed DNA polymerase n=1 Tax=candidate division MSBL1 archaeon SCGC-AAA259D14 TaxID=1698261 RepID=A0A133U8E9_9EURY|nr:hypothetical protein AKJ62_00795 [candidate division MSBL1 archaeon SCGC-AAA259D14]